MNRNKPSFKDYLRQSLEESKREEGLYEGDGGFNPIKAIGDGIGGLLDGIFGGGGDDGGEDDGTDDGTEEDDDDGIGDILIVGGIIALIIHFLGGGSGKGPGPGPGPTIPPQNR